ncbi:MAG: hypothetical protein MJ068_05290 [Clostridia bacterium]|nr:hypothetical protein [Clostridia bacterium]
MNDKVTLPESWLKKFKNEKLRNLVSDSMMWFTMPNPMSAEGRKRLKRNEPVFRLAESLSVDYAFEPNDNGDFELIPASVRNQGIGFSASRFLDGIDLDIYFFPCDFSEDSKRKLPPYSIRVPIESVSDIKLAVECAEKYFPMFNDRQSAIIPFSNSRIAVLKGMFIDDFSKTSKICREATADGEEYEIRNCERFLEFIKTVGLN